ncbi:MAG TPA: hypothetical protein P5165_07150 [Spirochaetia bacterium]|nr:hypothetical protein [Spirochaetales bacterium]HRY72985.1 hypothetical protein [Spirochaetia bacterium]
MRREDWLRAQDRKRRVLAWAATAAAYLLALGLVLLVEGFRVEEVSDYAGPVRVSLGSPEGNAARGLLESPPELSEPPAPAPAEPTPPEPAAAAPTSPATPAPAAPAQPKAPAAAKPAPAAAKPAPAATASAAAAPSAPAAPTSPPPPEVARGTEAGNDYETSFGGDSGLIRRSLKVPIYRYLPPPFYLDQKYVDSIAGLPDAVNPMPEEARRRLLITYYAKSGDVWKQKLPVPLDVRERLWVVLEEAGFDPRRADYKLNNPKPITLSFTMVPIKNQMPELRDLRIIESSGFPDLDEAVMYGFQKAGFSSDATKAVTGRFVYRFN